MPMETETIQLITRRSTPLPLHAREDSEGSISSDQSPRQRQRGQNGVVAAHSTAAAPSTINSSPGASSATERTMERNNYKYVFYDLPRAGAIGILTGAAVAVFKIAIESIRLASYSLPGMKEPPATAFVPAFGGLLVGLLAWFGPFPPGLKGIIQETDVDSKALFFDDDSNQKFNVLAFVRKTIAAIVTLGTGCSMGPGMFTIFIFCVDIRFLSKNESNCVFFSSRHF